MMLCLGLGLEPALDQKVVALALALWFKAIARYLAMDMVSGRNSPGAFAAHARDIYLVQYRFALDLSMLILLRLSSLSLFLGSIHQQASV